MGSKAKKITTTILIRLKMTNCVSIRTLNLRRLTSVAQASPGQTAECCNLGRHLIEQSFNAHKAILSRDIEHELVEKLPFRPSLAFRLDGFHKFLHPTFHICECAALLGMGASREEIIR